MSVEKLVTTKNGKYKVVFSDYDVAVYRDTGRKFFRFKLCHSFFNASLMLMRSDFVEWLGTCVCDLGVVKNSYVLQAQLAVLAYEKELQKEHEDTMKKMEEIKKLEEWDGVVNG